MGSDMCLVVVFIVLHNGCTNVLISESSDNLIFIHSMLRFVVTCVCSATMIFDLLSIVCITCWIIVALFIFLGFPATLSNDFILFFLLSLVLCCIHYKFFNILFKCFQRNQMYRTKKMLY